MLSAVWIVIIILAMQHIQQYVMLSAVQRVWSYSTREYFFLQIWVMCGKSRSKIIERSILCRASIDFRSKDWADYSMRWIVFCWRKPSMIWALYYFALLSCRVKLSTLTLFAAEYVLLNSYWNQWSTEKIAFNHPNTSVFLWSASKYWILSFTILPANDI